MARDRGTTVMDVDGMAAIAATMVVDITATAITDAAITVVAMGAATMGATKAMAEAPTAAEDMPAAHFTEAAASMEVMGFTVVAVDSTVEKASMVASTAGEVGTVKVTAAGAGKPISKFEYVRAAGGRFASRFFICSEIEAVTQNHFSDQMVGGTRQAHT